MLHSKSPIFGERPKGKYSTAKQLNGQRGFEILLKLGNAIFSDESKLQTYFFCKPIPILYLKHDKNFPHYIDGWVTIHWSRIEGTSS